MSETLSEIPVAPADPRDLPSDGSKLLRIFARNSLWLWLDLGGLRIGTMVAGLFLIRYFGPTNFGIYTTAIAVGWVVNAVTDLGVTRYAAREVAADPADSHQILGVSLLTTLAALALQVAFLVASIWTGHTAWACIAAGLILCNFEGTSSFCSSVLTAELRSRDIIPSSIVGILGMIGMTILVIVTRESVLFMLLGLSIKAFVVLCLRLLKMRPSWPDLNDWLGKRFVGVVLKAWPYFQYNLTQIGYLRIAIICFGLVASQEKVGWFAAAFVLSDVFPQWSYACSNALLPVWTKLFESKRFNELIELRQRLLDVVVFTAVPVWIALALFAPQICQILGSRYANSATVLRIVASRSLLSVLDGFIGHGYLIAVNQVKLRQKAQARSLALLAGLTLLLGWLWGPLGVAAALFVSDCTLILQYLNISQRMKMKIEWPAALPAAIAGGAMIATVLITSHSLALPIEVPLAFSAYFFGLLIFSRRRLLSAGRTLRECVS